MTILVSGSLAFDTIMVFPDQFRKHILADQIHILNVSFVVPEMRREYGGTAGNIGYNLALLGVAPTLMATVGHDFEVYAQRLEGLGIARTHVRVIEDHFTAQAFITTDIEDNQITAFHPGAMAFSHSNKVSDASGTSLAIVSPAGREGMIAHAKALATANIPYIFDPGQGLPLFSGDELMELILPARVLAVNDYEARLVEQKTGTSIDELSKRIGAVIVTRGAEGSTVHESGRREHIHAVKADAVVDPTGCGDAYRAGLLYGMERGWGWPRCARLGSVLGSLKIAHRGGQNHRCSRAQIGERLQAAFGDTL